MPPEPCTVASRFTSFRVAASRTTSADPAVISTCIPSGVNFSRFAPATFTSSVATTFFVAMSITDTVPSWALATHASLPSGDTSKPSDPRPTGITISFQSPPGAPGGGPGGPPAPGLPPCGGPPPGWHPRLHSRRRPTSTALGLLQNRHGRRVHISGHDALAVRKDVQHVGPVLSCSHDPVDLAGSRVIAADRFGCFCRKPYLALREHQAMRTAQCTQIDRRHLLLRHQIDHRQRMKRAKAVVRDISRLPVRRRHHLMRIVAHRNARYHMQRRRIDDRQRMVLLGQSQQCSLRRGLRSRPTRQHYASNQHCPPQSNHHAFLPIFLLHKNRAPRPDHDGSLRSEEHTSELQSLRHL